MKPKKKMKKLRITEADFLLANRRAARLEEIAEHGRPVSMRSALHKSKKVYDRKRLKKAGIGSDDLPFGQLFQCFAPVHPYSFFPKNSFNLASTWATYSGTK